jgi:hypothetical protein
MGIGRRQFLQLCGQTFASFVAASTSAVALIDDRYVNRKFGITFTKPPGWRFADVRQMGELAAGQVLAADVEFTSDMLEWIGLPFVAVHQDADAGTLFTSSAQFFVIEDCPLLAELDGPIGELMQLLGESPLPSPDAVETAPMLRKAREDLEACSQLFKSFVVVDPPRSLILSGCPSATYCATHLYEHPELATPVRVRVKTIFTLHRRLAYLMRLIDSPHDSAGGAFCFDTFLSSIAFV